MIFTKGAHQSAKFQTSNCSGEISPICTLIDSICWKYKKFQLKKYSGVMSHDTEEWCKIWRKTFFFFKNDKNLVNFDPSTKKLMISALINLHFDWSLLCKVYNVWPKKVQRNYISWHWRLMQNLKKKKNWLVVWKMTWGIWQSFIRTLENVKIGTFMGFFYPKQKMYELRIYRELCVMTLKNDGKSKEELTCPFKTDIRNSKNVD